MPPTTTRTNGTAIRAIRERTGLSVRAVTAELQKLGVHAHEDHLRNLETGARKGARPELVNGLAAVLKIPITAIVFTPAPATVESDALR